MEMRRAQEAQHSLGRRTDHLLRFIRETMERRFFVNECPAIRNNCFAAAEQVARHHLPVRLIRPVTQTTRALAAPSAPCAFGRIKGGYAFSTFIDNITATINCQ